MQKSLLRCDGCDVSVQDDVLKLSRVATDASDAQRFVILMLLAMLVMVPKGSISPATLRNSSFRLSYEGNLKLIIAPRPNLFKAAYISILA